MRQIAQVVAGARAKLVVKGTPKQVVDMMEEWYVEEACDGFNVMPPYLPGGLNDFVEMVIPEMQRRGLFRTEYTGRTLARTSRPAATAEPLRHARQTKRRNSARPDEPNPAGRARARRRLCGADALGRGAAAVRGRRGDGAARAAHVPRLLQEHRRPARHACLGRADVRPQRLPARLVLGLLHGADAIHRRALRRARPAHPADGAAAVPAAGAVGLRPRQVRRLVLEQVGLRISRQCGRSACCIS